MILDKRGRRVDGVGPLPLQPFLPRLHALDWIRRVRVCIDCMVWTVHVIGSSSSIPAAPTIDADHYASLIDAYTCTRH